MNKFLEAIKIVLERIANYLKPSKARITFVSATGTGTIASNSLKAAFRNSGGANGTVTSNGTSYTLEPDEIIVLDPGYMKYNDTITYDGTGTTLKIIIYY